MKKMISMLLAAVMAFSLAACSNTAPKTDGQTNENNVNAVQNNNSQTDNTANSVNETPSTITVEHAFGTTEVPYNIHDEYHRRIEPTVPSDHEKQAVFYQRRLSAQDALFGIPAHRAALPVSLRARATPRLPLRKVSTKAR